KEEDLGAHCLNETSARGEDILAPQEKEPFLPQFIFTVKRYWLLLLGIILGIIIGYIYDVKGHFPSKSRISKDENNNLVLKIESIHTIVEKMKEDLGFECVATFLHHLFLTEKIILNLQSQHTLNRANLSYSKKDFKNAYEQYWTILINHLQDKRGN